MQYLLPKNIIDLLVSQPETGMCFQHVELTMKDGSSCNGLVINCQNLHVVGELNVEDIVSVKVLP